MIFNKGDVLTAGNSKYLVLENARYAEVDYIFVNKLDQEELSDEYFVMEKNNSGVLIITDKKILDIILPIFTNKIEKDVKTHNDQTKFEI